MNTMTKITMDATVENTRKAFEDLRNTRINSFDAAFNKANDYLYELLGSIYEKCVALKDNKDVKADMLKQAEELSLSFGTKTPAMFSIALKIVFADADKQKKMTQRLSSYKRVLDAVSSYDKYHTKADFIEVVKASGGIEELRRSEKPKTETKSAEEKSLELALELTEKVETILPVPAAVKDMFLNEAEENEIVAMVGVVKNGEIVWIPKTLKSSDKSMKSKLAQLYNKAANDELAPIRKAEKDTEAERKKAEREAEAAQKKLEAAQREASKAKARAEANRDIRKDVEAETV